MSDVTGRYYQSDPEDFSTKVFHGNRSWCCTSLPTTTSGAAVWGGWADGHVFPDGVVRIHLPATIKSLLKLGLLVGNVGAHQCLRRLAQQLLWQPLAVQPLL